MDSDLNPYRPGSLAHAMKEIGAGRRAFPVSDAKRHHIVPRFLLSRFAVPSTSQGKLFFLARSDGANGRVAVRDAAQRHRFYAVESDDDPKDNRIEAFLGLVEDHAATAIDRLLTRPGDMDEYDQIDIAMFLTMQTQRTPTAVARIEDLVQQTAEEVFRTAASDPERFRADVGDMALDMSPEDVERGRLEMLRALNEGRVTNPNLRGEAWIALFDAWWEASRYPLENSWYLFRPEQGEFVISDSGFAAVPIPGGDKGVEATFPIAPNACLMLRTGPPGLSFAELSRSDVDTLNLRTYGWAENFVYGRTQESVARTRMLAKRRPRRVPMRPQGSLVPSEVIRDVVADLRPK